MTRVCATVWRRVPRPPSSQTSGRVADGDDVVTALAPEPGYAEPSRFRHVATTAIRPQAVAGGGSAERLPIRCPPAAA